MRLGQEDDGQLPDSTTLRRSYDLIGQGFGAGTNGPFLVAVSFAKPAHNDQSQLDELKRQQEQQQQQEQAAEQQAVEQGEEAGLSPQEAQQQADQQAQASEPTAAQQKKTAEQEQFLKSTASDPDLVKLENKIRHTPGVDSVSQAKVDKTGSAAVFTVIPKTVPSSQATQDLVNTLRDDVIPPATEGTDLTAYVGGTTAGFIDLGDRIGDKLPSVILIVVALSFILLMLAFRSLLVPLKAAAMNLLSIGAAYGVLTAVFEKGWGIHLIGLDHTAPIVSFVPLLMFAILFGLSMDYEVFLLTQVKEHYVKTQGQLPLGDRRAGGNRPDHHLGGADHDLRLLELPAQRRPGGQAVRHRARGRDRRRRDDRPLHARPRDHGPDAKRQLVPAGMARPRAAADQRRQRQTSTRRRATPKRAAAKG